LKAKFALTIIALAILCVPGCSQIFLWDQWLQIEEPQSSEEWSDKGATLARMGKLSEAIRCYDRALEIDPEYVNALTCKGLSLGALGRFDEAIEHLWNGMTKL
jgi:tetratricopeptide (TPR) repeat protein